MYSKRDIDFFRKYSVVSTQKNWVPGAEIVVLHMSLESSRDVSGALG